MYTVTTYPPGTFCWADLTSTDAKAATTFYKDLMGWESTDLPMGEGRVYTMFSCDGHETAALSQATEEGMPSFWTSYIDVDDVDALVDRVKELGGTLMHEPFDVFDNGRMMVITDPSGGTVALWQAKERIGAGLVNTAGAMSWNELATRDVEAAMTFFSGLLGWTFDKQDGMDYWVIKNKGRSNGGILKMTEDWGEMPPHWMVYFSINELDAALEKVKELGGNVPMGIIESDTMRFAVVADPAGAHLTLIEFDEKTFDTWPQG
ncbi:MAG: VOC family protein [Chloroflexi bacterium]|nr:VOC family protein [Chloroflexota bacterium]